MQNDTKLREALAAYAHEAWSGWMRYFFSRGEFHADGSFTIPAMCVERWQRQMNTAYADLPEGEKESDRAEADRMLALFAESRASALLRAVEGFGIDTYLSTPKDTDTYYEIDKLWDGTEWALSVGRREGSEEIARFPSFDAAIIALAAKVKATDE